ncbi:MAG: hypothetical protein KDC92_00135 [Bacteroidetes bacterium]|nr:hypothetical protein [Bacteroidota bacterium]
MNLPNPFSGLKAFDANKSELFFGRNRHVQEIVNKLDSHHFVAVVGNSGSGKSSLVKAGVIPRLQKIKGFEIISMRPGNNSLNALVSALGLGKEAIGTLQETERGLLKLARSKGNSANKILLVVDQFEEIFRADLAGNLNIEDSEQFIANLLCAISENDSPVYVMLTMRSDYLGDCEQFEGLPEAINNGQFLVPRMRKEELRESIVGPVNVAGGKISPRLVHQLLTEVDGKPDELPVLQHLLMRMWQLWGKDEQHDPIDMQHYQAAGGMQNALSNHAELVYESMSANEQQNLAKVLKVIGYRTADNKMVRRPATIDQLSAITGLSKPEIEKATAPFRSAENGFLLPDLGEELGNETMIDITHESFIRQWKRYKTWVNEEYQSAELYQRLTESALLFEQGRAGYWRNPDLRLAVEWRQREQPNERWAGLYNTHFQSSITFLNESERDYKFYLADRRRRRRVIAAVLILFLVALSTLSVWALSESSRAKSNADLAFKQKEAAVALQKLAEQETARAEEALDSVKAEKKRVGLQIEKTKEQRNLAEYNAKRAELQRRLAELSKEEALTAFQLAEKRQAEAELQKNLATQQFLRADSAQRESKRMQELTLAKNLAIKSNLLVAENDKQRRTKALLAMHAANMQVTNKGLIQEPDIYTALHNAYLASVNLNSNYSSHVADVKSVATSIYNGSQYLITSASDKQLIIKDLTKGVQSSIQAESIVYQISTAKEQEHLACASSNSIAVYSLTTKERVWALKNATPSQITGLHISGNELIYCLSNGDVTWYNWKDDKVVRNLNTKHTNQCLAVDGNSVLVGTKEGSVLSVSSENTSLTTLAKRSNGITAIAVNASSKNYMFAEESSQAYLGSFQNEMITELAGHRGNISDVAISTNANWVATACFDGDVRIWNLKDGLTVPIVYSRHNNWVRSIAFANNGNSLFSAGKDQNVFRFELDANELWKELSAYKEQDFSKSEWKEHAGEGVGQKVLPKLLNP